MKDLLHSLKISVEHLEVLDEVFSNFNYVDKDEYLKNNSIISGLNTSLDQPFTNELYMGDDGRQMILNDLFEYIFNGRGYYYIWNPKNSKRKDIYFQIILRVINQLMIYESISVNPSLRNKLLDSLKERIGEEDFFLDDNSKRNFECLKEFKGNVHFDTNKNNIVPQEIIDMLKMKLKKEDNPNQKALKIFETYTDSILPKLPHGLWRELIVYIQLLRINSGFVLPLLLNQRIVSKDYYLKPSDFLVIRDSKELVGVEVGEGKETQSSNFSVMMGCQMVTAINADIPPRCPICGKWILFCDKVIEDFCDLDNPLLYIQDDIRCAHDCDKYSYDEVLTGKCPYVKYRGKISEELYKKIVIDYNYKKVPHYHYSCILENNDSIALATIKKQRERWENSQKKIDSGEKPKMPNTINCLKTNYPHFDGLDKLNNYNKKNMKCFSKYKNDKNCVLCPIKNDCEKLKEINEIILHSKLEDKEILSKKIENLMS